ncbi:MAG: tryptophan 2,3-dioxygenase family protein [Bacteroidota bacterium]
MNELKSKRLKMNLTHEMLERLEKLEEKFAAMGQDMASYLDGLLYADYLTYWDYVHLDTLLSLQNPKTPIPDEETFIIYHQITELYFRLVLNAVEVLVEADTVTLELFKRQMKRINNYFNHLVDSFSIMIDGMEREQFLKFRMSLLPASGFQSAQYRMIEIVSTDFRNLVHHTKREGLPMEMPYSRMYELLYWKTGATELATGKKTLTLKQFEAKYSKELIELAEQYRHCNLLRLYHNLPKEDQQDKDLIELLQLYDISANVRWPLAHLRSAAKYLDRKPEIIAATGGTNWQKYLPPKNQRLIFYPELYDEEILANWGQRVEM